MSSNPFADIYTAPDPTNPFSGIFQSSTPQTTYTPVVTSSPAPAVNFSQAPTPNKVSLTAPSPFTSMSGSTPVTTFGSFGSSQPAPTPNALPADNPFAKIFNAQPDQGAPSAADNTFLGILTNTIKGLPAAAQKLGSDFLTAVKPYLNADVGMAADTPQQALDANQNAAGIAANTFLGLPLATVKVGQDILSNTLGKLGVSIAQDIETIAHPQNKAALDNFTPTGAFSFILGDQPISGLSTDVASLEQGIKNNPVAQNWGLSKFALPLAFVGVVGNETLNFLPFGGEGDAVTALKNSTDVAEVSNILRQIGVAEDLIPQVASKFADMTSESDVRAGLEMVNNLQQTTRVFDPVIGEDFKTAAPDLAPGSPLESQGLAPRAGESVPSETPSRPLSSAQDTINQVKLEVKGTGTGQRVRNAIGQSEALGVQLTNKGQDAYTAGRGLSNADLAIIRDNYQAGMPIKDVAALTSNPAKTTAFLTKTADYYDFQLAADRAAGGQTGRVENYVPQIWDLSKPEDLARFNQFAQQKGLKPYDGFSSQPRVFGSYAEGEAAGFKPKNTNILQDLQQTYQRAASGISKQALRQGLIQAAPEQVSMAGRGVTEGGKPFVNSNVPGMEGLSYHPAIDKMLQGYQPLKGADFVAMVKKDGAAAAIDKSGLDAWITKTVASAKSVPVNAKEAGLTGVMGSIYDHASAPLKQILWNWSGFHSVNITLNYMGASITHPIQGIKGALQSVGAFASEHVYNAVVDSYKNTMVKDSEGTALSVFDWAVKSGALEARDLPVTGIAKFSPLKAGQRAIFDREIPVLQLSLAEQVAKSGVVADSPAGFAVGKEIRTITGEINARTMNINPNTIKWGTRVALAPGFTFSKYKTLGDAFVKFGEENGVAGNLARTAVIGKNVIVGTTATLVTLLATGKFPNLQQILLNYTIGPSSQTNLTNPKGQALDVTYPKTFVSEGASAITNPVGYANARLNPIIADVLKLYTNQDYYGRPIVDSNINQSVAQQILKNIGIGHLPIGAQAVVNQLLGKQNTPTTLLQIGGLNTRVSASDPTAQKYAGIDSAKAQIAAIAPDDPNRLQKMQDAFNSIPAADRKSLQYQELMSGVSTKGVYISDVEQKYFQVKDLLAQGDTAGATAITKAMTKQEYTTYKAIKTKAQNQELFTKVQTLVKSGDTAGATAITKGMTSAQYKSYQAWKAKNPLPVQGSANSPFQDQLSQLFKSLSGGSIPTSTTNKMASTTLPAYNFTPKATNIINKELNINYEDLPKGIGGTTYGTGQSLPLGATTDIGIAPGQGNNSFLAIAHEVFHALFQRGDYSPTQFNKDWEAALKNNPDLQDVQSYLNSSSNNAAFHGNGENVTTDPIQLATERYSTLGSMSGKAGLKAIPKSLQKYYSAFLK